jgi:photosynthetic reaction center H subunit
MLKAFQGHYDLAILMTWAFFAFFGLLVLWLHRESKREGYPLVTDRLSDRVSVVGFPGLPDPKTYLLAHGGTTTTPYANGKPDQRALALKQVAPFFGAPYEPTGNPMWDGVGPASFAERADKPDLTNDGKPRIVPLRSDSNFHLEERDPDPRGMKILAADGAIAGTVIDAWVDRSESLIRYFEVEVPSPTGKRNVLVPHNVCKVLTERRMIRVNAITADQFAAVPGIKTPEQVTLLEEDKIMGYFGGGWLYATPGRIGPIL